MGRKLFFSVVGGIFTLIASCGNNVTPELMVKDIYSYMPNEELLKKYNVVRTEHSAYSQRIFYADINNLFVECQGDETTFTFVDNQLVKVIIECKHYNDFIMHNFPKLKETNKLIQGNIEIRFISFHDVNKKITRFVIKETRLTPKYLDLVYRD